MSRPETTQRRVLEFWFGTPPRYRQRWFSVDAQFDDEIRAGFLADHEAAAAGRLDGLAAAAEGSLALCILLDQFPRNLFRGSARAYATDAQARAVARHAVATGQDRALAPVQRLFLYLPFEHSEDLADQELALAQVGGLDNADWLDYARRHHYIIARFGRFPHRNAILGRDGSAEELAFLQQPGSSF